MPPSRSSHSAISRANKGSLGHARLDLAPLLGAEHAEDVFGREHAAFVLGCDMVDVVAHASRQVLSFNSPRRIQLFIVPSGTLMRSASCS